MFQQLDGVESRFESVNMQLQSPDVADVTSAGGKCIDEKLRQCGIDRLRGDQHGVMSCPGGGEKLFLR